MSRCFLETGRFGLRLLILWLACSAHGRELRFERVSIDHGLSQNTVYAILQDRTGFLWFGTADGLNRYDGYRFEVLRRDPADANSLSHNRIRAIYEDTAGILWIGTRNGGLSRYDRRARSFTRYRHDPAAPGSLASDFVWTIHQDRRGVLWIGTGGGGLDRFEAATGTFAHLRHDAADPDTLSHDFVKVLYEDAAGRLWVGTAGGLDRLDPAAGAFTRYRVGPEAGSPGAYDVIEAIHQDRHGRFWLGTGGGLVRFEPGGTPEVTVYRHDPGRPNEPDRDSVWDIHEAGDGTLWLATFGGGLILFDPASESFSRILHEPERPDSLSGDRLTTLYEDRSGALWLGTSAAGLNRFDRGNRAFVHYGSGSDASPGLSDDMVMAIHEDSDRSLWVGTWDGGLDRLDRVTGAVTRFRGDADDPRSLARDDVRAVLEDSTGNLWAGTEGGGLHRLDRATGGFTRYRHDPADPRSLRDDDVWVLYEDSAGILWVGTYGGGLSRYHRETDDFTHDRHVEGDARTLASDVIRALREDSNGHLWVGTGGGGLHRRDPGPTPARFTRFRYDPRDPESLSSDEVLCLHEDARGVLWIGTHGGGLNRLASGGGAAPGAAVGFRFFTERDGLPSNVIYGILEDDEGRLWMSTNRGLSRFDRRSETFRNYGVADGLQSHEFNSGAYFRSPSGEMFFGGLEGLNAFFPDRIEDNPYVPPVVLTSFKIFNREVPLATDPASLRSVTLRPDDRVVSFEFAALSYTAPEKNQYAYRLLGFRDAWTHLGTKRDVTFTDLHPGSYTLEVSGSNNDGVWNQGGLRLELVVEPPFWRTWWFTALGVVAAAGLIWAADLMRTRSLRRHTLALEAEVAERRRVEEERERLIWELEANNRELEVKNEEMERFSYAVSHDLKAPLITIKGFLGVLRKDVERGRTERLEADFQRIAAAADRMHELLNDLLELSRVGRLMNPPEEVALARLVGEALAQLAVQVAEGGVELAVQDPLPAVWGDRVRLLEIFQNLIGNAVKFMDGQEKPRVEIGARSEGSDEVLCWVRDNGAGIDAPYLEKVFGLFERLDPRIPGTGVGLALVQRIVEVHGGRAWAESDGVGRGSTFFFTLPGLDARHRQ